MLLNKPVSSLGESLELTMYVWFLAYVDFLRRLRERNFLQELGG